MLLGRWGGVKHFDLFEMVLVLKKKDSNMKDYWSIGIFNSYFLSPQ